MLSSCLYRKRVAAQKQHVKQQQAAGKHGWHLKWDTEYYAIDAGPVPQVSDLNSIPSTLWETFGPPYPPYLCRYNILTDKTATH